MYLRGVVASLAIFVCLNSAEVVAADCCKSSSDASCGQTDTSLANSPSVERTFTAEGPVVFASKLFDTNDFPARWYCGTWSSDVGWLHIVSDLGIFGAYIAIPCVLLFFLMRRPDIPFPHIIWLFAAFIVSCGIGHLIEACIFWWPAYRFAGLVKFVTAIVSWATVGAICHLTPKVLNFRSAAALAKESAIRDQMWRDIIAVMPCGVFWKDSDGILTGGNRAFAEMMEVPSTDELYKFNEEHYGFDLDAVRRFQADDANVLLNGAELYDYEETLHRDGIELVLRTSKVPLRDTNGNITGLVGVSTNITELKKAEQKFQRADRMFDALRSANIIGIATCGLDGNIIEANDEVLRILKASREDLESGTLNWEHRTPDEFKELDQDTVDDLYEHGVTRPFEMKTIRSDGTEIPILLGVTMLDEEEASYLCIILDISNQKQIEENLQSAICVAQEASRAKSEFLANMSHEIRTPLNGILGFTDVLRRGIASPDMLSSHLETIHQSGTHLLHLINDILDLSKIEAGKIGLRINKCHSHQVLFDVISILRVTALEKGLELSCGAIGHIPKFVWTDESRLRQVLMNLVGNAVKFTDEGKVHVLVQQVKLRGQNAISFKVTDTGIGMSKSSLDRIFSAFDQGDTSNTRRFGGTGLGLTISRHIANSLSGEIYVESEEGLGSTFDLVIPAGPLEVVQMIDGDDFKTLMEITLETPATTSIDLTDLRVLLCEDGETNRDLIQLVLEDAGAKVVHAENGKIGLDLVKNGESFDVVLMDMQMPVMDGYTAAKNLRDIGCNSPIVAITAHAMQGDEDRCKEAGCSDYLTKPIEIDKLLSLVAHLKSQSTTDSTGFDDMAETEITPIETTPSATTSAAESPIAKRSPDADDLDVEDSDAEDSEDSNAEDSTSPISSTLASLDPRYIPIVERFIDKLDTQIELMNSSLKTKDFDQLRELAHWLNGAGGTVGFDCFTSPAHALENAVKDGELALMESFLDELNDLKDRVRTSAETVGTETTLGEPR